MKTLTIHNTETETSCTVEVSDDFFSFIEKRHKKMGFVGDPSEMSERMYNSAVKSFEIRQSGEYEKCIKKIKACFAI